VVPDEVLQATEDVSLADMMRGMLPGAEGERGAWGGGCWQGLMPGAERDWQGVYSQGMLGTSRPAPL